MHPSTPSGYHFVYNSHLSWEMFCVNLSGGNGGDWDEPRGVLPLRLRQCRCKHRGFGLACVIAGVDSPWSSFLQSIIIIILHTCLPFLAPLCSATNTVPSIWFTYLLPNMMHPKPRQIHPKHANPLYDLMCIFSKFALFCTNNTPPPPPTINKVDKTDLGR